MECQILSRQGKEKFAVNGYLFVFDRTSSCGTTKFWRCERKSECKARIHTRDGIVIKTVNEHIHDSSAAKVEAAKVVTQIKRRAESTLETTSQVLNECISAGNGIPRSVQAVLPRQAALKKTIRRKRNEISAAPASPVSLEQLIIPDQYKTFKCNDGFEDTFLLADSGPTPNRILIFGRKNNLKVSTHSVCYYILDIYNVHIAYTCFNIKSPQNKYQ